MSQNIIAEVVFLFHSFLLGIIITFVYDGFLILRRLIPHNLLLISLDAHYHPVRGRGNLLDCLCHWGFLHAVRRE